MLLAPALSKAACLGQLRLPALQMVGGGCRHAEVSAPRALCLSLCSRKDMEDAIKDKHKGSIKDREVGAVALWPLLSRYWLAPAGRDRTQRGAARLVRGFPACLCAVVSSNPIARCGWTHTCALIVPADQRQGGHP
jgi:hypothetical protein